MNMQEIGKNYKNDAALALQERIMAPSPAACICAVPQ
jgi:hypothetical protein